MHTGARGHICSCIVVEFRRAQLKVTVLVYLIEHDTRECSSKVISCLLSFRYSNRSTLASPCSCLNVISYSMTRQAADVSILNLTVSNHEGSWIHGMLLPSSQFLVVTAHQHPAWKLGDRHRISPSLLHVESYDLVDQRRIRLPNLKNELRMVTSEYQHPHVVKEP